MTEIKLEERKKDLQKNHKHHKAMCTPHSLLVSLSLSPSFTLFSLFFCWVPQPANLSELKRLIIKSWVSSKIPISILSPAVSSLSLSPLFLFLGLPMAQLLPDARFRLPAHFLTADDLLMDKENIRTAFVPELSFPAEFPYEFDSPVGSTVTDSSDEEFLAGLTRRLAHFSPHKTLELPIPSVTSEKQMKTWAGACSPQSTLNGIGNWSCCTPNCSWQVSSPQTTPFSASNNTWDSIYAAAGEVARMKMYSEVPKYNQQQGRELLGSIRSHNPTFPAKKPSTGYYSSQHEYVEQCFSAQMQNRGRIVENEMARCGRPLSLSHSAWPPLQGPGRNQGGRQACSATNCNFVVGSRVKRESTGTGVFIPRKYGNLPENRKKTGSSTVLLPAKVVQALNLNLHDVNAQSQGRFNAGFSPDHDALIARRNGMNHEILLPQEWTY